MQLIAHRGYWLDPKEKNTDIAFSRALSHGFGIETDFRDLNGQLVVSHDIPLVGAMAASEFVALYRSCPVTAPLALNIKSDGLQHLVDQFIQDAGFQACFVFDMAVPDMYAYIGLGVPTYTRLSEYETVPSLLSSCQGVWLDAFESTWYDLSVINPILAQGKGVAIVSPELHGRSHMELWQWLKMNKLHEQSLVSLCTDFPLQAQEFFDV
jgi:hypothetical protein